MKMLISLLSVAMSLGALASSVETKTFFYDGSQNSVELLFQGEKTHTEYRYETRQTICYREQYMGNRTTCTGGGNSPRYCTSYPVYQTVPYPCSEQVTVPYQVHDYFVDARVIVDVTKLSEAVTPGETIKVTLNGDHLSFSAIGSKKFLIATKKSDIQTGFNGQVKMIDALLAVELVEAAPLISALKMDDLSVSGNLLKFSTNKLKNIGLSLSVEKKKLFGDEMIFSRELTEEEVAIKGSEAEVNFHRLGFELLKGKYEIIATSSVRFDGPILNSSQFSGLSASKKLVYKVR